MIEIGKHWITLAFKAPGVSVYQRTRFYEQRAMERGAWEQLAGITKRVLRKVEKQLLAKLKEQRVCIQGRSNASKGDIIYLASAYSHPDPAVREARFQTVCRVAAKLVRAGDMVFSPIAHSHPIAEAGRLPTGFDCWEAFDRAMIAVCSEVWVLANEGWQESRGVAAEIEIARELGKPVNLIYENDLPD